MSRFFKYFEYAYLVFAAFFLFETIRVWNDDEGKGYLYAFFVVVAVFMFFFRRKFRKKFENRK